MASLSRTDGVLRLLAPQRECGWWKPRPALVLFLACLVPLTPLLAQAAGEPPGRRPRETSPTGSFADQRFFADQWQFADQRQFGGQGQFAGQAQSGGQRTVPQLLDLSGLTGPDGRFSEPMRVLFLLAQTVDRGACETGQFDADRKVGGELWFFLGFVLNFWALLPAYLTHPEPDAELTAGKSPAFLKSYVECYSEAAKKIHVKWTWIGIATIAGAALIAGLIVYLLSGGGKTTL